MMMLFVAVDRCVEKLDSLRVSLLLQNEQLHRVERCIRVLERVSHLGLVVVVTCAVQFLSLCTVCRSSV